MKYVSIALLILLSLVLLLSCSTQKISGVAPLKDLILRPLAGYEGKLVNRDCQEFKGKECIQVKDFVMDLTKLEDRKQLWELNFRCNVNGKRFGVCQSWAGLCEVDVQDKHFLGIRIKRTYVVLDSIDIVKDYKRLLNADAKCASRYSAYGEVMFVK